MNTTQIRDTRDMRTAAAAGREVTAHLSLMGMTTIRQSRVRLVSAALAAEFGVLLVWRDGLDWPVQIPAN